jgi:hypothetical protein
MEFFDFKIFAIVLLAIGLYVLFNEVVNLKRKLDELYEIFTDIQNKNLTNSISEKYSQQNLNNDPIMTQMHMMENQLNMHMMDNQLNMHMMDNPLNIMMADVMSDPVNLVIRNINIPIKNEVISENKIEILSSEKSKELEKIIEENTTDVNSSSPHKEVYSNDALSNEIISNNTSPLSKTKDNKDYKNILKNLNKYKLAELQDIAIENKIPIKNNNIKKTRSELIEDIKNNFSNKNI